MQLYYNCSYGREDEEVMGLRFSNEAIMSIAQLWPRPQTSINNTQLTPLQVILCYHFVLTLSQFPLSYFHKI